MNKKNDGPLSTVSDKYSAAAEMACFKQRCAIVPLFLRADKRKATSPADTAMCERVLAAARDDMGEFENLITFPEVRALFDRGALYYGRRRAH